MSQLVYSRDMSPRSSLLEELKEIFRATPVAILLSAIATHR